VTGYGPGALHVAGDNEKVGRVAREPVNGRSDHRVAGGELLHQCAKLRPVGRGAGDLLAEHLFAPSRLQLAHLSGFILGGGRDARVAVDHLPPTAAVKITNGLFPFGAEPFESIEGVFVVVE
jgi:hypothetical protein